MTEKLKQLMDDHARTAEFAPLDLDAVTSAGDLRRRRRRWVGAGTALAAAAAVAVVAVVPAVIDDPAPDGRGRSPLGPAASGSGSTDTASDGASDSPTPTTVAPGPGPAPVWSTDSVIHSGDQTIDTGRHVDAFVRTRQGYVFASDGQVFAVSADGERRERIGFISAGSPRLVADPAISRVGWVRPAGGLAIYDQWGISVADFEDGTPASRLTLFAIDGDTAYWRDPSGVVALDVVTGQRTVVDADPPAGYQMLDARDGVFAVATDDGSWVGTDREHSVDVGSFADVGALSDGADFLAVDADDLEVYDARTGDPVAFDLSGYAFASAVTWLDADHVEVIASVDEKGPAQLMSCSVPAGECTTYVEDLGDFADLVGHFQLPVGVSITG